MELPLNHQEIVTQRPAIQRHPSTSARIAISMFFIETSFYRENMRKNEQHKNRDRKGFYLGSAGH